MNWIWHLMGAWREGVRWTERLQTLSVVRQDPLLRAQLLSGMAFLLWQLRELEEAVALLAEAEKLQRKGGDPMGVVRDPETAMNRTRSETAFRRAHGLIPGGVNSPARAFGAVGGLPLFIARGDGPYLFDLDGHRYLDYVG